MASGIRTATDGRQLVTLHTSGGTGSSSYFPDAPWIDFHMRQNGHGREYTDAYAKTLEDYRRTPIKPVLDGEPIYEDHPVSFKPDKMGYSIASDVRRPLYWDLFNGACGHTYGHHAVWQFWTPERKPINGPLMPWKEALQQPGAGQMRHGRKLMESRPMRERIPEEGMLVSEEVPWNVPGSGAYRFVACRDRQGTYAMVYVPVGRRFESRCPSCSARKCKPGGSILGPERWSRSEDENANEN